MDFKYKKWNVSIEKGDWHFTWTAYNSVTGKVLEDQEGGELGDMRRAKYQIKEWIDEYENNPFMFQTRHPELVRKSFPAFSIRR